MTIETIVEKRVREAFDRIEKEVEYDATQWNGMLVWEAGDADTVHKILTQALREAIIEALQGVVMEKKDIGYEDGQELPTTDDEFKADLYETKADAWFAGWDNCREELLEKIEALKKVI